MLNPRSSRKIHKIEVAASYVRSNLLTKSSTKTSTRPLLKAPSAYINSTTPGNSYTKTRGKSIMIEKSRVHTKKGFHRQNFEIQTENSRLITRLNQEIFNQKNYMVEYSAKIDELSLQIDLKNSLIASLESELAKVDSIKQENKKKKKFKSEHFIERKLAITPQNRIIVQIREFLDQNFISLLQWIGFCEVISPAGLLQRIQKSGLQASSKELGILLANFQGTSISVDDLRRVFKLSESSIIQNLECVRLEIKCRLNYMKIQNFEQIWTLIQKRKTYSRSEIENIFNTQIPLERCQDVKLILSFLLKKNENIKHSLLHRKLAYILSGWKQLEIQQPSIHLITSLKFSNQSLLKLLDESGSNLLSALKLLEERQMLSDDDRDWLAMFLYSYHQSIYRVPYRIAFDDIMNTPEVSAESSLGSTRNLGSSRTTSLSSYQQYDQNSNFLSQQYKKSITISSI